MDENVRTNENGKWKRARAKMQFQEGGREERFTDDGRGARGGDTALLFGRQSLQVLIFSRVFSDSSHAKDLSMPNIETKSPKKWVGNEGRPSALPSLMLMFTDCPPLFYFYSHATIII